MHKQNGFSLIEILVAISIIGIVTGVIALAVSSIQRNTRDSQRETDLRVLQSAIQQFYADQNHYPNTDLSVLIANGSALTNCSGEPAGCIVSKTYISKTPKDPNSPQTNYCYMSQFSFTASAFTTANECTSSSNSGKCHYYELCAKLENQSGTATCTCSVSASVSANFKITPL